MPVIDNKPCPNCRCNPDNCYLSEDQPRRIVLIDPEKDWRRVQDNKEEKQ
jgi:hypothetical protein